MLMPTLAPETGSTTQRPGSATIRVGLTEGHGLAQEICRFPADGVHYSFLQSLPSSRLRLLRSPIKGLLDHFEADGVDLIEAVLSPIRTKSRWVCSLGDFAAACAFDFAGAPLPRPVRVAYIKHLFSRKNFKKLMFRSHAGLQTLSSYGGLDPAALNGKATVVYPAVGRIADDLVRFNDGDLRLFFSGDFFRKGGVHVVDAFERVRQRYPGVSLTVCCDERIDFNTPNQSLRTEYLGKINTLPGIVNLGRISRERLMTEVYPETDIFLMPTYVETFGMAIVEAMAFGLPVITTNYFAIPEIVEDGVSGLLIDTRRFDCDRLFVGYTVRDIPPDFRAEMTDAVFTRLCRLIESFELRKSIGLAALNVARTKFSFDRRNAIMLDIYRQALAD